MKTHFSIRKSSQMITSKSLTILETVFNDKMAKYTSIFHNSMENHKATSKIINHSSERLNTDYNKTIPSKQSIDTNC